MGISLLDGMMAGHSVAGDSDFVCWTSSDVVGTSEMVESASAFGDAAAASGAGEGVVIGSVAFPALGVVVV